MDYSLFIKNKFLKQSIGDFSTNFDKVDYRGFEQIVSKNTVLGMGKIALSVCRKSVKSVFDSVDGIGLNIPNEKNMIIRKDGYVDKDEMFQLIKESYKAIKGKELSEEEISKMTVKQAIDIVIDYWDTKNKK